MDVYVISNIWSDGATVIGAAASQDEAERTANLLMRSGQAWTPWREVDADLPTWERVALRGTGRLVELAQEIRCVPMAAQAPDRS